MKRRGFLKFLGIVPAVAVVPLVLKASDKPTLKENIEQMNRESEGSAMFGDGWDLSGCHDFNPDISQWDVSKVSDWSNLFKNCKS